MKKLGSTSDFTPQRDSELYSRFKELLAASGSAPLRQLFGQAAAMPASRFWVSAERAAIVISDLRNGRNIEVTEKMTPMRQRMYAELRRRVDVILRDSPQICLAHAVEEAVQQPAPEFYLTDESARLIIYRHRRRLKAAALLNSKRIWKGSEKSAKLQ